MLAAGIFSAADCGYCCGGCCGCLARMATVVAASVAADWILMFSGGPSLESCPAKLLCTTLLVSNVIQVKPARQRLSALAGSTKIHITNILQWRAILASVPTCSKKPWRDLVCVNGTSRCRRRSGSRVLYPHWYQFSGSLNSVSIRHSVLSLVTCIIVVPRAIPRARLVELLRRALQTHVSQ